MAGHTSKLINHAAKSEPVIQIGILTSATIEYVLNGNYSYEKNIYTGRQKAETDGHLIKWNGDSFDTIELTPTSTDCSFDIIDVVIGIGFHWERKETQRFKGALKLIVDNGQLTVINRIGVEDYLTSVISSEMSATASDELLKAHAVISRSWLLHPILNNPVGTGRDLSISITNKNVDDSRAGQIGRAHV